MFGLGKKKVDTPLAETRNWYSDRYEFVVVQRNMLFFVTIVALLGVAGAVFAVAELASSKTVEPYIIEVEERTGITTLVNQTSVDHYSKDEAVKRYFVWHYINARESYNVVDYEYNYGQVVRLMSSDEMYAKFYRYISGDSPDSPTVLGRVAEKKVKLKSLTFLNSHTAQVRVAVEQVKAGSGSVVYNRIITLDFTFANMTLSTEERFINPLGFQVTDYRIDEDTVQ